MEDNHQWTDEDEDYGDTLRQEACRQMKYTKLEDSESDDDSDEKFVQSLRASTNQPGPSTANQGKGNNSNSNNELPHTTLGKLAKRTTIPALSECIAHIYQEDELMENCLLVQPILGMAEQCFLSVATSLDNANQPGLNCRMINPSGQDITLPEHTTIAYLTALPHDTIISPMENPPPRTSSIRPAATINNLSKPGDVMFWNQEDDEPDIDYGLDTLPFQEEIDEEKPITSNIDEDGLTKDEIEELRGFLEANKDLFAKHDGDLGDTDLITHKIDVGDAPPVKKRPYRLNPDSRAALEKHVDTMLKHNIIEESTGSPWASPVVLVRNPNNKDYRFCLDMGEVNKVTKEDAYPLPRIDDTLDALNGSKYFSSLDLKSAFHQVRLDEESKHLTTFATHIGCYSFIKMPYGLSNASATFQKLMDKVLRHLHWHICMVYLDDIIAFSRDFQSHLDNQEQIFQRLPDANLKMHPEKCRFMFKQLTYLGYKISEKGREPLDEKTEAVKSFESPKNTKQIKQFLGLTGYFRDFIEGYSDISTPLTALLKKNTPFKWTQECEDAFQLLKEKLISSPVLAFPDFNLPFELHTDASTKALGYILRQRYRDGSTRVISYRGRTLSKAERNCTITELELLALIDGCLKFSICLRGKPFTVYTDHANLQYLLNNHRVSPRATRWALKLSPFKMAIVHKPGKENTAPDAISRLQPEVSVCTNTDPYDHNKIAKLQREDRDLLQLITYLETGEQYKFDVLPDIYISNANDFFLDENGVLHKLTTPQEPHHAAKLLVIPTKLRQEIMLACHDYPLGGHLGIAKTMSKIQNKYWWPLLKNTVIEYIKTCGPCMRQKKRYNHKRAPTQLIPESAIFEHVHADALGPLPLTRKGNQWILIFTDRFSRCVEAVALPSIAGVHTGRAFYDEIITRHGFPRKMLTDRGTNFLEELFTELNKIMKIKKLTTTAYRPQCNGHIEQFNETLVTVLTMYFNKAQDRWDDYLTSILFAYRTSTTDPTGETPFMLFYGLAPQAPDVTLLPPSKVPRSEKAHRPFSG